MNEEMCKFFEVIWSDYPDTLHDGNYKFKDDEINDTYCTDDSCKTDIDKIMAGWLYFFKTIIGDSESITNGATSNMNTVQYITIWLSYMLSLKNDKNVTKLYDFYTEYINEDDGYAKTITADEAYNSYSEIINKKKDLMNMHINDISKFYNAFKTLCSMYNDINNATPDCSKYYTKAKTFFDEYNKLNGDSDNNENSSYRKILSSLSTDYGNFKGYCNKKCHGCGNIPDITYIKTKQKYVDNSVHVSEATVSSSSMEKIQSPALSPEATSSSASIAITLIPVLLIFSAIPVFLRIAYKYSLFGIDKRLHRQYLREKIKKIKKKMNNYI
ncbi:PIR protein CIR protein [Plasmodium vinckei brucechwatti]|uniref:PIR protein CIR protein n=1 Tax=Plasmodium vinckei brucechwatti TaxID=119398 RepID=A0A6V7RUU4_PLAVN|nr:PIR protein CIR protein [Plasmodium vinckei brucechwatti]